MSMRSHRSGRSNRRRLVWVGLGGRNTPPGPMRGIGGGTPSAGGLGPRETARKLEATARWVEVCISAPLSCPGHRVRATSRAVNAPRDGVFLFFGQPGIFFISFRISDAESCLERESRVCQRTGNDSPGPGEMLSPPAPPTDRIPPMAETELERAEKRFAQAKARLQALKNREATKARKIDTRRKVILGGLLR